MEFIDRSQEITELAKALLKVQRQMSPALKDGKNPFTKSNYATLNSVMEACRDALLSNNIWLCQYPVPVDIPECIGLMTKLTHTESGEWQASLAVVPLPRSDPQGMGSAITYARRYAITAMLGMVTEDDDGEGAKKIIKTGKSSNKAIKSESFSEISECPIPDKSSENTHSPLPELDGVQYEFVTAQDGRECVLGSPDTKQHD